MDVDSIDFNCNEKSTNSTLDHKTSFVSCYVQPSSRLHQPHSAGNATF